MLSENDLLGGRLSGSVGSNPRASDGHPAEVGQEGSEEHFQRRNPWAKPWGPQEPAQVQSRDQRKEGQDIGAMKGEPVALKELGVGGVGKTVRQGRRASAGAPC